MLNLKKEAKTLTVGELKIGQCPICASYISQLYHMEDAVTKKKSMWYSCSCGVVWQMSTPGMVYDAKYASKFDLTDKKLSDVCEYPVHIYSPLIEELIYGRKALLIGSALPHHGRALTERGWIVTSIDRNTSYNPSEYMIVDDFETHAFPPETRFNMIWMEHTLECFLDPVSALMKIRSLLTEDGILFIASPDTDFIHTRGSAGFRYWRPDTINIMWNKASIVKQLEKLGFNVIMARQNTDIRFVETDDIHLIAQVKFF